MRGTTPKFVFKVNMSTDNLIKIHVLFSQNNRLILRKDESCCTMSDKEISVELTQTDTFMFDCSKAAKVQLRALTADGKAVKTKVFAIDITECLEDDILALDDCGDMS